MMKSKLFIISILVFILPLPARACGPFATLTKNPIHFLFPEKEEVSGNDENIILWQHLTSESIPKDDIYEAVYKYTSDDLKLAFKGRGTPNKFISWILKNKAEDIQDFLLLAKEVEEIRSNRVSPWYYPSNSNGFDESSDEMRKYDDIMRRCRNHTKGRLADRYALQAVRMLFSFGEYNKLIDYYNSFLASCSNSNYFKKKAKGYLGGALLRLGHKDEANKMFLEAGDMWSFRGKERYYYMALYNPESQTLKKQLNTLIGYAPFSRVDSIADAALRSTNVVNRGDWLYLKAYCQAMYNDNYKSAKKWIGKARKQKFSDPQLDKDARFFEICVRAKCGDIRNYQQDALWMLRECRNRGGLWFFVIPEMLRQGLVNEALLLANYDTEPSLPRKDVLWNNAGYGEILFRKNYMLEVGDLVNLGDQYSNTGFQMLQSMKPEDIIRYKCFLKRADSKFVRELKPRVRHDDEYLNELIGTLYMRKGNYDKAIEYLRNLSVNFQKNIGIYDYLDFDPWQNYAMIEDEWEGYIPSPEYICYNSHNDDNEETVDTPLSPQSGYRFSGARPLKQATADNAKYRFAKGMAELKMEMNNDPSPDRRAFARLKYAIGRLNSFDSCWALTQYWNGNTDHISYQYSYNHLGDCVSLDYIQDYPEEAMHIYRWFSDELRYCFSRIQDPEIMAEAQLLIHNYRTIARHYPDTQTGRMLASRCDNWKDWL